MILLYIHCSQQCFIYLYVMVSPDVPVRQSYEVLWNMSSIIAQVFKACSYSSREIYLLQTSLKQLFPDCQYVARWYFPVQTENEDKILIIWLTLVKHKRSSKQTQVKPRHKFAHSFTSKRIHRIQCYSSQFHPVVKQNSSSRNRS